MYVTLWSTPIPASLVHQQYLTSNFISNSFFVFSTHTHKHPRRKINIVCNVSGGVEDVKKYKKKNNEQNTCTYKGI
jgi:hypothetical protein